MTAMTIIFRQWIEPLRLKRAARGSPSPRFDLQDDFTGEITILRLKANGEPRRISARP